MSEAPSTGGRPRLLPSGLGGKRPLLLIVAALIIAGFAGSASFAYFAARDAVRASIERDSLPIAAELVYARLQKDLVTPILVSSVMAQDSFLHDWAARGEKDLPAIARYLAGIRDTYGALSAFFVSEATRRYYHPGGILKTIDEAEGRDAWYFRVRSMTAAYELNIDPDLASGDTLTVFINYRVLDAAGNFIGAVGIGLPVQALGAMVARFRDEHGTAVYFVDLAGRIVAGAPGGAEKAERIDDLPGLARVAAQGMARKGGSFRYARDGATRLLNVSWIPELSWFLFVEAPEATSVAGARGAFLLNLALGLLVLVLVLWAATATIDRYQTRLEHSASVDPLTGALNRLAFGTLVGHALATAARTGRPISALLFDVDDFKTVNDVHGHPAGDETLRRFSAGMRRGLRESDLFGRWGGEEFIVVLPDCGLAAAVEVAGKLRRLVAEESAADGGIGITASAGVAERGAAEDFESLLHRADVALLAAKRAGKDRAVAAPPPA